MSHEIIGMGGLGERGEGRFIENDAINQQQSLGGDGEVVEGNHRQRYRAARRKTSLRKRQGQLGSENKIFWHTA